MKISGYILLLHAILCLWFAQASVDSGRPEVSGAQPIKHLTDRGRSIRVQYTSNDADSNEGLERKQYPIHGLSIKLRLNYDTGLEKKLREQGKDLWETLDKVAAEAQKHFVHTNGKPYLRLNIRRGDSFTYPQFDYGELGAYNLDSYAKRPKPEDIDADIYIAKQPTSVTDSAVLYRNQVCRNKDKSVALVLHNSYDPEALTGQALAASVATLLGLCKNDFSWSMQQLLTRYEEGRLPCLSEECIDHDSCSSQSANSCSDRVTAMLCPYKCNKCVIIFPPNGLQLRLRLNYNKDFEKSWESIGVLTAMHNIVGYSESYFVDENYKPYLRFEIINGSKFTGPSEEGVTVFDLNNLAQTLKDTDGSDADIFFGDEHSHIVQGEFYGSGKNDEVCKRRWLSLGTVLQSSFSYEAGTAETFKDVVAILLGLRSKDKTRWTMKEFTDAYENGKYQCLKPYVCHDQFPCNNRDASKCLDGFTKYLCPILCGQCKA